MPTPSPRGDAAALGEAIDRLRAASEGITSGVAYTCGPPWFNSQDGVLIGSPDPHAGQMIADTDMSFNADDDCEIDGNANATFIAEAWNFAGLILGRPDLLAALRSAEVGRDGGVEAMRAAAIACALRVGRELGEPSIGYRISNAILALSLDPPPPATDTAGRTEP